MQSSIKGIKNNQVDLKNEQNTCFKDVFYQNIYKSLKSHREKQSV
jgi:hypothetical protein